MRALRIAASIVACGLAGVLQVSAARFLPPGIARPSLPLAAAAAMGIAHGPDAGALAGMLLGLFVDAEWSKTLGVYALLYLYAGAAAGFIGKWRFARNLPAAVLAVFSISLVCEGLLGTILYALPIYRAGFAPASNALFAFRRVIAPAACMNALASIPFVALFHIKEEQESDGA